METKQITISFEEWFDKYKPILNPLKEKSEEHDDEDYQIHWHTIEENDLIKDHIGSSKVWTVVEVKRDSIILKSGFHRENRMYHYISQIPYNENIEIVLFEGYPEITKEDLQNLKYQRGKCLDEALLEKHPEASEYIMKQKLSLDKIIEYIERTGV